MSTVQPLAGSSAVLPLTARERHLDRRFFTGMAVAALLVVVVGFAPSYYFRAFSDAPPLRGMVHVHGLVATSWMLLFLAQTSLVSTGRTDLHRRLGTAGPLIAGLFIGVSYATAISAARLGVTPPGGPPALAFLAVPIVTLLSFAVFAVLGLPLSRDRETHKRLMLLATIAILPPAFARFRWFGFGGPPVAIGGPCLFILACLAYDRAVHRRIHPAFLWGGTLLLLSLPGRFALARTDAWLSIAKWLTR
jgi:hypothetical protein